jgi:surface carbohydrate biosynthesis protein (TIGR04326 family)
MIGSAVVWDQEGEPPAVGGSILCWRSYSQHDSILSIPGYLEDHAKRLREKYLAFIHELGEYRVRDKRVIDHMDMGDGLSLWWMTQLAEKSPFKSPRIYDCLRLLALEEVLIAIGPKEVLFVSTDEALGQSIQRLCRNLQIRFRTSWPSTHKRKYSLRKLYETLPFFLQGLLSMRHFLSYWSLSKVKKPEWFSANSAVFICSYFIHLDPVLCAAGHFYSRQWEELPAMLKENERPTNWIQLFLFSAVVPDLETGIDWLDRFNRDSTARSVHRFLQSYLTLKILIGVVWTWVRLNIKSWQLHAVQSAFTVRGSAVWLWPILRRDWHTSFHGPVALSNCLWIALFDALLADMPHQKTGLYLCENQAWEKALLRAWQKYGHGEIIGVQHATVPFWHLYYFDDPRTLSRDVSLAFPLPDRLAVNGAAASRAFAEADYPMNQLIEVEALRYLHLMRAVTERGASPSREMSRQVGTVRVIVLGDMVAESMDHLMGLLERVAARLPPGYEFTLKAHPGHRVALGDYPGFMAKETHDSLSEILANYDVAVAANGTSAAVDAFIVGLPVIIALDGNRLNLSPLRGEAGACFVCTVEGLTDALLSAKRATITTATRRADFFFLDKGLPRWRRLLEPAELAKNS